MRKVLLAAGISLDGYIARPDGSFDFLFVPKGFSMEPFFRTIDAEIMGRKTYEASVKAGAKYGSKQCFVYSRSMPPGERDGVVFTRKSPAQLVAEIRKRKGKNISLAGGGEMAREFLKADLVDEIDLGVVPVLLGDGIPLFPAGFPQRNFALIENKTYSRGLIELKYRRVRRGGSRGKT